MKETALTFIGHGTCYGIDKEMIKTVLRPLIADKGIDTFYSGGMGDFDWVCARAVYELKAEFPHIRNYLVIPYLSFTIRNKDMDEAKEDNYRQKPSEEEGGADNE